MKKTTTKIETDVDFMPDDELQAAQVGAFVGELPRIAGEELRPLTAGSMALLQAAGNRLIFGDASRLLLDAAGYWLLHRQGNFEARRIASRGSEAYSEFVAAWLDEQDIAVHNEVLEAVKVIGKAISDYERVLTKSSTRAGSGNGSGRTG